MFIGKRTQTESNNSIDLLNRIIDKGPEYTQLNPGTDTVSTPYMWICYPWICLSVGSRIDTYLSVLVGCAWLFVVSVPYVPVEASGDHQNSDRKSPLKWLQS